MEARIFVELLSNIGVVQVQTNGEIISVTNNDKFKSDIGNQITIAYNGQSKIYKLPFEVVLNEDVAKNLKVNNKTLRCKYLINRLVKPDIDDLITKRDSYSKSQLTKALENDGNGFLTANCFNCLVELFRIDKNFPKMLELPDENWREMMELWHCHKPDIKKDNEQNKSLDQIFSNKILPKYDNLLIGDSYYLINTNLFTKDLKITNNKVHCYNCDKLLGSVYNVNDKHTTCKILKQKVVITNSNSKIDIKYEIYDYLTLTILKSIKNFGSRFFTVRSKKQTNFAQVLLIWCFDYGLSIGINDVKLDNRLKIMYQKLDENDLNDKQNLQDLKHKHNFEEIILEDEDLEQSGAFEMVIDYIEKINNNVVFDKSANIKESWKLSYI
ncbi:hypothetical protein ACO0SA_002209 [Hanseniaspora valbyensis]